MSVSTAAALSPDQVLVLFNSSDADSQGVWNHYSASRPGVHGFDLNDPTLQAGTISYADFVSKLRDPIRAHLEATGLAEQVVVLVLTRGLPHRIQDLGSANVGDNPGAASSLITSGNATYASVDSELTLLWQDLNAGEAGGGMDSAADNRVENPYFNLAVPVADLDRTAIRTPKYFENPGTGRWRMKTKSGKNGTYCTAGDMYLVSRLDGNSLAAVKGMIDRGKAAWYDPEVDQLIQDKSAGGTYDGGDYTVTEMLVAPSWPAFVFEESNLFLIGQNGNLTYGNTSTQRVAGRVAALTGYGGNHDGYNRSGFMATFSGQLSVGAVYSGYESYNARKFGGVGGFGDHGQLSDWVDAGGTFGVGNAWEPLVSGAPKNYALLKRYFVDGLSWVESAWSSAPFISWQTVVIGDPLTVASFTPPPPAPTAPVATIQVAGALDEWAGGMATAVVELSAPVAVDTPVHVSFSGADEGSDFQVFGSSAGMVTIPANGQSASFDMVALQDELAEGTEVLEIRVDPGNGYEASADAAAVAIADTPLGDWLSARFGHANLGALADGDPDGDGLNNLVEYAMGFDPLGDDRERGPAMSIEAGAEGAAAVYRFRILPTANDVTWRVECSDDLVNWVEQPFTVAGTEGARQIIEVRRPVQSAGDHAYFRVKVTWP